MAAKTHIKVALNNGQIIPSSGYAYPLCFDQVEWDNNGEWLHDWNCFYPAQPEKYYQIAAQAYTDKCREWTEHDYLILKLFINGQYILSGFADQITGQPNSTVIRGSILVTTIKVPLGGYMEMRAEYSSKLHDSVVIGSPELPGMVYMTIDES
jgi:hypothetical protein